MSWLMAQALRQAVRRAGSRRAYSEDTYWGAPEDPVREVSNRDEALKPILAGGLIETPASSDAGLPREKH